MNTRNILLRGLAVLCLVSALFLSAGCISSKGGKSDESSLVQDALDALLPPTFTGYASGEHKNQYFTIKLEADGLRRTEKGWTWTWLTYNRQSNFPLFPGFNWSSTGEVTLGRRP